jgi:hypothetical protein
MNILQKSCIYTAMDGGVSKNFRFLFRITCFTLITFIVPLAVCIGFTNEHFPAQILPFIKTGKTVFW